MIFLATIFGGLLLCVSTVFAQWSPGQPFDDPRDGQQYRTVVIGEQVWMAENLNVGTMISSNRFGTLMRDNGVIERYCWQNQTANCDGEAGVMKRGGLYEWEEAVQSWSGQPALPVQGICPDGWHVSSQNEWRLMTNGLGATPAYIALVEGGETGFDALFAGYRDEMNGSFKPAIDSDEPRAHFWTADQSFQGRAQAIEIGPAEMRVLPFTRASGLCIRCIKDEAATGVSDLPMPVMLELHGTAMRSGRGALIHFSTNAGTVDIVVSDLLGRTIHQSRISALQGENYHYLDLASCAAGAYILRLQSESGIAIETLRLM